MPTYKFIIHLKDKNNWLTGKEWPFEATIQPSGYGPTYDKETATMKAITKAHEFMRYDNNAHGYEIISL